MNDVDRPYLRVRRLPLAAMRFWDMPVGYPRHRSRANFDDAPAVIRVWNSGSATSGSSRQMPSSRANACFLIGVCTVARPPRSPTMPRDITAAPENGSMLPTACTMPSSRRNSAACVAAGKQHAHAAVTGSAGHSACGRPDLNVVEQSHFWLPSDMSACPSGTMRPDRASVNSTVGSATSGALTNETNRDSFSGSSSTPFHSHA